MSCADCDKKRAAVKKARAWKAFLPIPSLLKTDEAPGIDLLWLASRGIEGEALSVLRCVRYVIQPLVTGWSDLADFHFLVHTRAEGVPAPPEDSRAFIDLSLYFKRAVDPRAALRDFAWVAPRADEKVTPAIAMLNTQSKMYLELVESGRELSDVDCLKNVCQHLHYWANMSQTRIQ